MESTTKEPTERELLIAQLKNLPEIPDFSNKANFKKHQTLSDQDPKDL